MSSEDIDRSLGSHSSGNQQLLAKTPKKRGFLRKDVPSPSFFNRSIESPSQQSFHSNSSSIRSPFKSSSGILRNVSDKTNNENVLCERLVEQTLNARYVERKIAEISKQYEDKNAECMKYKDRINLLEEELQQETTKVQQVAKLYKDLVDEHGNEKRLLETKCRDLEERLTNCGRHVIEKMENINQRLRKAEEKAEMTLNRHEAIIRRIDFKSKNLANRVHTVAEENQSLNLRIVDLKNENRYHTNTLANIGYNEVEANISRSNKHRQMVEIDSKDKELNELRQYRETSGNTIASLEAEKATLQAECKNLATVNAQLLGAYYGRSVPRNDASQDLRPNKQLNLEMILQKKNHKIEILYRKIETLEGDNEANLGRIKDLEAATAYATKALTEKQCEINFLKNKLKKS